MTVEATRLLFGLAAAAKAAGDLGQVDEAFLATVCEGIQDGVQVIYLFADRDEPPTSIENASLFDVFVLEMEGEEGQTIPVPLLKTLDPQLAASLFAAAEFRPREDWDDEDDGDWDDDGSSWGGDESPPGYLDVVDWGCDDDWGDLDDNVDDD